MSRYAALRRCNRGTWALSEPAAVWRWQLGLAWSSLAAVVDAATGRGIVLSGFVLIGPVIVLFSGRWLRTAVAGAWAVGLVTVLGVPDGIWGSRLESYLIVLAIFVAVTSTLSLLLSVRTGVSLTVTAFLAAGCGSQPASSSGVRPAPPARTASCREQYQDWQRGPGFAADRRVHSAVKAVRAAEKAGHPAALRTATRKLMPAAVAAGIGGAVPACADPSGLYTQYVSAVYQSGHDARRAHGVSGLRRATAPLRSLGPVETRLAAEISRTAGA
jgi:hypothetical protein